MPPMGNPSLAPQVRQGKRHTWTILAGDMGPELLEWLRAEKSLQPGTVEFERLGVAFEGSRRAGHGERARHFRWHAHIGSHH